MYISLRLAWIELRSFQGRCFSKSWSSRRTPESMRESANRRLERSDVIRRNECNSALLSYAPCETVARPDHRQPVQNIRKNINERFREFSLAEFYMDFFE
jgi:hypothetical protein